jgi:hypothetical protein
MKDPEIAHYKDMAEAALLEAKALRLLASSLEKENQNYKLLADCVVDYLSSYTGAPYEVRKGKMLEALRTLKRNR